MKEATHHMGQRILETNCRCVTQPSRIEPDGFFSCLQFRNTVIVIRGKSLNPRKDVDKGYVLAERHQVHLLIDERSVTLAINQDGPVRLESTLRRQFEVRHAHEHGTSKLAAPRIQFRGSFLL